MTEDRKKEIKSENRWFSFDKFMKLRNKFINALVHQGFFWNCFTEMDRIVEKLEFLF